MLHPDCEEADTPRSFRDLTLLQELWSSTEQIFSNKITWLLVMGPIALIGDATGWLGEPICFAFSGIALIPCAERLSYVTEQVAAHTNGTIGALLNATFGNAPELLISTAALRNGFYRVTQLTMLGSMLCNLLLVFGLSCLVGGARWQVQELRITSGNVSVGMLLASVGGSLLPAALIMSGQLYNPPEGEEEPDYNTSPRNYEPSDIELSFSRVNAVIMIALYIAYLLFQIGTHKDEFDEEENVVETEQHLLVLTPHFVMRHHGRQRPAQRNLFCLKHCFRQRHEDIPRYHSPGDVEMINGIGNSPDQLSLSDDSQGDVENVYMPTASSLGDNASSLSQRSKERRKLLGNKRTQSFDDKDVVAKRTPSRAPVAFVNGAPTSIRPSADDKSHDSDMINNHRDGIVRRDSGNEGE